MYATNAYFLRRRYFCSSPNTRHIPDIPAVNVMIDEKTLHDDGWCININFDALVG